MSEDFQLELEKARAAQELARFRQKQRVGGLRSFFTGEGRTEGYPELGTSGPSVPAHIPSDPLPERYQPPGRPHTELKSINPVGLKLAAGYSVTPDPKAQADIAVKALKEVDPSVSMGEDRHGNPTITFEGKTYYVNAPGVSSGDFFTLLGQIATYAPATRLATARKLFTRMRQMGYGAGVTSVVDDLLAGKLGSEQGVDWTRAGLTALTGAAFEGLAPAVVAAWRKFLNRPGMYDPATGQLTEKGKELAYQAGLDPEQMSRSLAKTFAEEAIDERLPELAGPRAVSRETGVNLTQGQQMLQAGETGQITWEQAARSGAFGEGAAATIGGREFPRKGFLGQQERDVEGFMKETAQTLSKGKGGVRSEAEGGAVVGSGLKKSLAELEGQIDAAYDRFRDSAATLRGKTIETSNFRTKFLYRELTDALENFDIDPGLQPRATRSLQMLKEEIGKNEPITARRIEVLRRKLRNQWEGAKKDDKKAVGIVIDAYDEWLDRAVTDGFFDGDQAAIDLVKDARKLRTEKRLKFGVSDKYDDAGKVIEDIVNRDADGQEIANYIFGKAQLGDKQATTQAVGRIRQILGEDSPEWHSLRESAWIRLYQNKDGTLKSPEKFVTDYDALVDRHPELMKELFSDEEREMLYTARALMSMRKLPQRAGPAPNSGFRLMNVVRRGIHMRATAETIHGRHVVIGPLGHIFAKYLPWLTGRLEAQRATQMLPKPKPKLAPFTATGTGAANVADPEGELRKDLMP